EINEGRGFDDYYVHLDLRHLGKEKIMERLPGIREISMYFAGVDPIDEPIPVRPGQHYSMGGIHCNKDGETPLNGLFTVGETACMSVHGANRLGGNSLLETLVFGRLVGQKIGEYVSNAKEVDECTVDDAAFAMREKIQSMLLRESGESHAEIKEEMGKIMDNEVGVFRDQETLESALKVIRFLKERYENIALPKCDTRFNYSLVRALEMENMLQLAEVITMTALMRRESRGAHWRIDYDARDDENFLKHSLVTMIDDFLKTEYIDVNLGMFEVKERKY
ncbi:MAG: FAD-binding protein, partial [Promethearchaeota archaeon]